MTMNHEEAARAEAVGSASARPWSRLPEASPVEAASLPRRAAVRSLGLLAPAAFGALGLQAVAGAKNGHRGKGETGKQGKQGKKGKKGVAGPIGPTGLAGGSPDPGVVGPMGPQGQAGEAGLLGPQGPQGPQGTQGPAGVQGQQGPQGPKAGAGAVVRVGNTISLTGADGSRRATSNAACNDGEVATGGGFLQHNAALMELGNNGPNPATAGQPATGWKVTFDWVNSPFSATAYVICVPA